MFKLLATLALSFCALFGIKDAPKTEYLQTKNQIEISVIEASYKDIDGELLWENEVYTYEDEGGEYTLTLVSETAFELLAVAENGDEMLVKGQYELENNVITLFSAGKEFGKFNIVEDNKLVEYEEPVVIEIDNGETEEDTVIIEENAKLIDLIKALEEELSKEKINLNNIAKLLVAILFGLGSIAIALCVKIIKLKIKNIDKDELYHKAEDASNKLFEEYQKATTEALKSLEAKVIKKIDTVEEQRVKEAQAQSLKLRESVELAKKNLAINDVLNEE